MKVFTLALAALFASSLSPVPAQTMSGAPAASMPTCASGDRVVWENTGSKHKTYFVTGSKYYGKTKKGAYACESAAKTAGYHLAGSMMGSGMMSHHKMKGSMGSGGSMGSSAGGNSAGGNMGGNAPTPGPSAT